MGTDPEHHVDHGGATRTAARRAPSPWQPDYSTSPADGSTLRVVPGIRPKPRGMVEKQARPEASLAEAAEERRHGSVVEHLADRAGQQRRDRQHGQLVELLLRRDR